MHVVLRRTNRGEDVRQTGEEKIITYKSSSGMNSMKRHLRDHHKTELPSLEGALTSIDTDWRSSERRVKNKKKLQTFFNTHGAYPQNSVGKNGK